MSIFDQLFAKDEKLFGLLADFEQPWRDGPSPATAEIGAPFWNGQAAAQSREARQKYLSYMSGKPDRDVVRIRPSAPTGLPFFVSGQLETTPQSVEQVLGVSDAWLFDGASGSVSRLLFGIGGEQVRQRLNRPTSSEPGYVQPPVFEIDPNRVTAHVWYQQTHLTSHHGAVPVFGGSVITHFAIGDDRNAVSSSYFPIPDGIDFATDTDPSAAKEQALNAIAIYPYRALLNAWLERLQGIDEIADDFAPRSWLVTLRFDDTKKCVSLLREMDDILRKFGPVTSEAHAQIEAHMSRLADWMRAAKENDLQREWKIGIIPTQSDGLVILPFDGDYVLAYEVVLAREDKSETWRAFVTADGKTVLGEPELRVLGAPGYFATSSAALPGGQTTPLSATEAATLATDVSAFATVVGNTVGVEGETILFHSRAIQRYFVEMCLSLPPGTPPGASPSLNTLAPRIQQPSPRLEIDIEPPNVQIDWLSTFFSFPNHAASSITFQTGAPPGGLTSQETGQPVFAPAFDPEVICHEMTHWLMFKLNPTPFEQVGQLVPFARALLEGCANYYAHSLADRDHPGAQNPLHLWAQASYRQANWLGRWSLMRGQYAGGDALPAPNLYPNTANDAGGLPAYDVGMILARALWLVRAELLVSGPANRSVDITRADAFILNAYAHYTHGYISNFEALAEGIIFQVRTHSLPAVSAKENNVIRIFSEANILAERGVQTMAQVGGVSLRGDDKGVQNVTTGAPMFAGMPNAIAFALAAPAGARFFAAAEDGIYDLDVGRPNATPKLSTWVDQLPLSIVVANNAPAPDIGTRKGLFRLQGGVWTSTGSAQAARQPLLVKLAEVMLPGGGGNVICASTYLGIRVLVNGFWKGAGPLIPGTSQPALCASLVFDPNSNAVFAGTLAHGVFESPVAGFANDPPVSSWQRHASLVNLNPGAVLCLAMANQNIVAGATNGLFLATKVGGAWQWAQLRAGAVITSLLVVGNNVIAGDSNGKTAPPIAV